MSVYVDNFYETGAGDFGRMKMSHLWADSTDELITMVKAIGVNPKWIQYPGTLGEHFDIAMVKRQRAIEMGAKAVNFRDYGKEIKRRTERAGVHWATASITKCDKNYQIIEPLNL